MIEKKIITLPITGMTRELSVSLVEETLLKTDGVLKANVNLATKEATLEISSDLFDISKTKLALEKAGFGVGMGRLTYDIPEMDCAVCASYVKEALCEIPGVISSDVHLSSRQASIEFIPGLVSFPDIKAAVKDAGYDIESANVIRS